jgi:hypothetical protein
MRHALGISRSFSCIPQAIVRVNTIGGIEPAMDAITVKEPFLLLAVSLGAVATPAALVVAVAVPPLPKVAPAPVVALAWTVNVTSTPGTSFPNLSVTSTPRVTGKAEPAVVVCGVVLLTAVTLAGWPGRLVRLKGVARPLTEAVTVKVPATLSAVKAGAVATPLASVVAVTVLAAKLPPALELSRSQWN